MEKMSTNFKDFISGYSIEVVPNSAAKIESFKEILPINTRVYIAHLETENIATMIATAKRINEEGFTVMPHIPARIIKNEMVLNDWISMYQNEAGVDEALLLAGGSTKPVGDYDSSIQLIESGLFDKAGFKRLHIAGHPEGSKDIDPDGGMKNVSEALSWKQEFSNRTDAAMAIAPQFCFDAKFTISSAGKYFSIKVIMNRPCSSFSTFSTPLIFLSLFIVGGFEKPTNNLFVGFKLL